MRQSRLASSSLPLLPDINWGTRSKRNSPDQGSGANRHHWSITRQCDFCWIVIDNVPGDQTVHSDATLVRGVAAALVGGPPKKGRWEVSCSSATWERARLPPSRASRRGGRRRRHRDRQRTSAVLAGSNGQKTGSGKAPGLLLIAVNIPTGGAGRRCVVQQLCSTARHPPAHDVEWPRLDARGRALYRDGASVALGARGIDILCALTASRVAHSSPRMS